MSLDDFSDFPAATDNQATESASPVAPAATGGIHFKDAGELASFRKDYPDKAALSDKDFLDWFGRSRTVPVVATVGTPEPVPSQGQSDDFSDFQPVEQHPETLGRSFGLAGRAIANGLGQIGDILSAPVRAIDAVDNLITPNRIRAPLAAPSEVADSSADALGLPVPQNDTERLVNAAGSGLTGGLATAGLGALADIPALATSVASQAIGGAGAGAGGELARQNGAGPVGQIAASLAGGLSATGLASGIASAGRNLFARTDPSELLAAFQRQQVQPMASQVGGFGSRMMQAGAKATLGGLPLAAAAERSIASAKAAVQRIAGNMGRVVDDTEAGQAAIRGAKAKIEQTGNVATDLYNKIPIRPDTNSVLANTRSALSDLTAGLPSNPELSAEIKDSRFQRYLNALTPKRVQQEDRTLLTGTRTVDKGGQLSWRDLKNFRTYIGEMAGRPTLQSDSSQDALRHLYAGISEDMRATAASDSPQALRAFQRANTYYRARQARIDNTLSEILGKKMDNSGETAFRRIEKWSRNGGESAALARTMRSMPPDESATIRATIFSRIGMDGEGADAYFSPTKFATFWRNKLDGRAKSVLFPGQEYRRDIDDITRIADSMKSSEQFSNTSRTALAQHIGGNLLGTAVVGYFLHPVTAIGGEGIGYAAGHLLASPRFARWLASAPRKPVGPATLAHINRLSTIAQAEPAIANEVLTLQQRLAGAMTGQPIAASPSSGQQENDSGTVPPQ